jgi:hypothetical protein
MAPESKRSEEKLAASMPVCFKASRQSSELPAKAIMAITTSSVRRTGEILDRIKRKAHPFS